MLFVEPSVRLAKSDRLLLERLQSGAEALKQRNGGSHRFPEFAPTVGLLSPDGKPKTAVPVAVFGPNWPNRVVLVGEVTKHLSSAELLAEGMRGREVGVIVAAAPVNAKEASRLAAVSLGDAPEQLILLDPNDLVGEKNRKVFQRRVNVRNRDRTRAGAEPLGYSFVGAGELARFRDGGPRTVRTAIDCLTATLELARG